MVNYETERGLAYTNRKMLPGRNSVDKEEGLMMPLTMARPGETVTIRRITGKDDVRQHLAELGFVVDSDVTVVTELAGNLIIQVKDCRVALDRTMAGRIMI